MHHFNRPKLCNNSLIRDQKSNKHIANGYKKLVHTFKREAVQFFVANSKRDHDHVTFCGLPFAVSDEKRDAKGL